MKFQYYAKHNGSKTSTILKKYFRSFSTMLNIMVPKHAIQRYSKARRFSTMLNIMVPKPPKDLQRSSPCFSTMLNIMVPKPRLKFWDFGFSAYSWGVWMTPNGPCGIWTYNCSVMSRVLWPIELTVLFVMILLVKSTI